jgi:RNA polymerase sigma-70 factor (ECF subfamily)
VALTLRLLGGLSTGEIARAFLVSESTAAQRIVRAKRAIRDRRLPYRVPEAADLPLRLPSVLDVIYLIFNEGYAAREGETLLRQPLVEQAIRLARLVADLLPEEPEALGLLALLELQASRSATRSDAEGQLVLLEHQDRSRWDRVRIQRARALVERALTFGSPGSFTLQAAIAGCHASAQSFEATDWRRIAALYAELAQLTGSPVVELNRAVAVGMASGPGAALPLLEPLADEPRLARYPLLPATRADLLRRQGRFEEAAADYRRAIALTHNAAERSFLEARLAECARRD